MLDGQEYTFGVSGKLIRNVLVMYDRQTDSLWSQLLGEAVSGPLQGTRLEFLPVIHTTWEDWRTRYPHTLALEKGYYGEVDPYESYYASSDAGVLGASQVDLSVGLKEFVLGVEIDELYAAFPFSVLSLEPVVNYQLGPHPILVVFNPDTATGVAFDRIGPAGQTLTFEVEEGLLLRDLETGSIWDGLTGEALSGSLAGEMLTAVRSTQSFWFGWYDFHPETEVYSLPED